MRINIGQYASEFRPWRPADGRVFDRRFAFDTETTLIDDEHPDVTPRLVLGDACDGQQGYFLTPSNVRPFLEAHPDAKMIFHNAAFDLRVLDAVVQPALDVYQAVEENRVWDTLVLKRLHSLATAGHTARGDCALDDCARVHLGVNLLKEVKDAEGREVRTSWGRFLGRDPQEIPAVYLDYLGQDVLATWHLFGELDQLIHQTLWAARTAFGYVNDDWLRGCIDRFGPLTHHIQLRASIIMDVLQANGIGIDQARREEKLRAVQEVVADCRERMRRRGYLPGERGCQKALQKILEQIARDHPEVTLRRTESGKLWSTAEEDLNELVALDEFFTDFMLFRTAQKLESTYLSKMARPRLHPKFGFLLETGRTYCGGGFNLQNLPREKTADDPTRTIRGCFAPAEGNVFIDSDFAQIELVVLGYACERQFNLQSELARLVNSEQDVHRLIAARILDKQPTAITKPERDSVKPVSFGRPGGMAAETLRKVAKAGYGIDLTTDQVEQRIAAYHQLCPELNAFLQDDIDSGLVIAQTLGLTPALYNSARGKQGKPYDPQRHLPNGWLGGMLLKVLREVQPLTGTGRPYTPAQIDFYWDAAQRLPVKLKPEQAAKLQQRTADHALWEAVRNWAGRRSVFTLTGRLRANTPFCSSRNNIFQGPAADGAIFALWYVWRAGFKLVDFVHDQLVVESPADDAVAERVGYIEALMEYGMQQVVPGMLVKVETVVTQSLNKKDLDPRYNKTPEPKETTREPMHPAA